MASMVAQSYSSTSTELSVITAQEKGSRNKRKFRADPPLADPNKIIPLPLNECTSSEVSHGVDMFSASQDSSYPLKLDLGLSCHVGTAEVGLSYTREEIEALKDEFHDVDWNDLTESELEELILSNLDTIFKSAIKKIVASGYSEEVANKAILRSGLWYGCKDMVSNIVDDTLAFLRSGQDIDPTREYYFEDLQQMEKYMLAELVCLLREIKPLFSTGDAMWCLLICDMNVSYACAMDSDAPSGNSSISTEPKPSASVPFTHKCSSEAVEKPFTAEEKVMGSRRASAVTRREYILRQKSIHLEKHHRSKGTSRSGKGGSLGGLVLDKKLKNNSFKIGKPVRFGLDASNGSSLPIVPFNSSPSLPVADTELSLTFPAKNIANPTPISFKVDAGDCGSDRKEEMIMKLVPRVKELRNNLQEWTEWANQKVMQAARRLGKDKGELKTLRQEKEEVERLKKEKQTLEENTMKKLVEMENARCKASGQVARANAAVRRLESENAALRQEMETAKLHAVESAASCQEVSKREKRTLMKFQSREKQKTIFQEDLTAEKRRLMQLQQKLKLAKDAQDQAEARLNQEEKEKDVLLTKISSFRKEREQIEVSAKCEEDMIKLRADNNLLKYKSDIARLEKEISGLRLKTDSSRIAALRRGAIEGSYASKVTDLKTTPFFKDSTASCISRIMASTDFPANGSVKRERECVMCLSDEMSVVFLPCAHQVVCTMCNELHEKQGMKDCPSCRSPIQRRVCVRYARS